MSAIRRAVDLFDSQAAFARAIDCFQQQVTKWLRTEKVPAIRCAPIEQACRERADYLLALDHRTLTEKNRQQIELIGQGIPTCAQLRPDVFAITPPEHDGRHRTSAVKGETAEATQSFLSHAAVA